MNEHDLLEIQCGKMKAGYAAKSVSEMNALKEKILSCIDSKDMRECLWDCFEDLMSWELIAIIVGSQKPLEFKYDLLSDLAHSFPHPFAELDSCDDFEPYVELYKAAFDDMNTSGDVFSAFLLNQHEYSQEADYIIQDTRPFPTFLSAIKYIQDHSAEWFWDENIDEALTWFTIEKWVGNDQTSLKATYTVSKYGEVWDYRREHSDLHHKFGTKSALGLYLPVPFAAGDVITIDCRPFAPFKHGVIVSVGDNHDCCCVQCLYAKSDGTLDVGALKHSHVFDDGFTPLYSPLYRAQVVRESLPADEAYFREIGDAIAQWDAEWRDQEDFDPYTHELESKVWALLKKGNTKDEFLILIKEA